MKDHRPEKGKGRGKDRRTYCASDIIPPLRLVVPTNRSIGRSYNPDSRHHLSLDHPQHLLQWREAYLKRQGFVLREDSTKPTPKGHLLPSRLGDRPNSRFRPKNACLCTHVTLALATVSSGPNTASLIDHHVTNKQTIGNGRPKQLGLAPRRAAYAPYLMPTRRF